MPSSGLFATQTPTAQGIPRALASGFVNALWLGTMTTGMVKTTVLAGTGVLSTAVAGTDYVAPSSYASPNGLTMATARLLGRTTAGTGAAEEITVGTGLSLSGGALTATGVATSPGGSTTQLQYNLTGAFAGAADVTYVAGSPGTLTVGALFAGTNATASTGPTSASAIKTAGGISAAGNSYFGGIVVAEHDAIGVSSADGLIAYNGTNATNGNQQYSPNIRWIGQGYNGSGNEAVDWRSRCVPIQGTPPTGRIDFDYQRNGAGYQKAIAFGSAGTVGLADSDRSNYLYISAGSNLSADRTLSLVTGDAARTLTLTGDATLNQDVSTAGSPTVVDLTLTGILKLGNAYVATPQICSGYVTLKDSTGAVYKVLLAA